MIRPLSFIIGTTVRTAVATASTLMSNMRWTAPALKLGSLTGLGTRVPALLTRMSILPNASTDCLISPTTCWASA